MNRTQHDDHFTCGCGEVCHIDDGETVGPDPRGRRYCPKCAEAMRVIAVTADPGGMEQ